MPPEPQDLMAGASNLYILRDVAAAEDTVFAAAIPGGVIASSKVISCPAAGCAATPATVGAINGDPFEGFLAAFDGKVFWARRSASNTTQPLNEVVRANLDGSGLTALITEAMPGLGTSISRAPSVYDDYALVFDISKGSSSGSAGTAPGLRVATTNLLSPPLPGIKTPAFTSTAVTGNDTYFAYWADPTVSPAAPYDRKVHIYDLDGEELGVTTETFSDMDRIQISGNTLFMMGGSTSSITMYACTLPACTNVHEVGAAVGLRGFDFQIRNGRVYFASVEDPGCGIGLQGVLASCDVASLAAGTCTRQLHSTSFHWVNLFRLEVEDNALYGISKTDNQALFKAVL